MKTVRSHSGWRRSYFGASAIFAAFWLGRVLYTV